MNNQEIINIIEQLEKIAPQNNEAIVKFRAFGEVALYANHQGYLRLAIEMLKCAISKEELLMGDLNYLFSEDSDFSIDYAMTSEKALDDFIC